MYKALKLLLSLVVSTCAMFAAVLGRDRLVSIATGYGLDNPGIEPPWPSGLRRGSAVDRLLELRVRIPPGAWMFVLCVVSKDKRQNAGQLGQATKYE